MYQIVILELFAFRLSESTHIGLFNEQITMVNYSVLNLLRMKSGKFSSLKFNKTAII